MNNSTIKIDLSNFFPDERRKAVLLFNPIWTTVACLQKRVEALFDLDAVRFLDNDGCYIPPQECIEVIKFCAGLKAFVLSDDVPKKKSKTQRSKISKICESEEIDLVKENTNDFDLKEGIRKRKYRSLENGITSSTPNKAKRVKNDVLHPNYTRHPQLEHKPSEISSTSEQLSLSAPHNSETKLKKSKSRNIQHCESSQAKVLNENKNGVEVADHNESKKDLEIATAQNRKEFTVDNGISIIEDCEETNLEARPTSLPSSTLISKSKKQKKKPKSTKMKNPFKDSIPYTSHIYYDEAGEITTTTTGATTCSPDKQHAEVNDKILLHCTLNDMDAERPRIFSIKKQCTNSKASEKAYIEIQENILLNPYYGPTPQGRIDDKESEISALSTLVENKNDIDESNLNNREAQSSTDERNDSSTVSTRTINIAIDKSTKNSIEVSHLIGDDCSNLNTSETNGNNVSSSQTARSESNENNENNKLNGSSIALVDCVDLSVDLNDGDDSNIRSNLIKSKLTHDESNYDSSDVEEVSEVINLNDSEEPSMHSRSIELKPCSINLSKIMALSKKMAQLPEIGDIVVFKVSYKPAKGISSLTDFITGEVQYINKRTKYIKLLILDGLSELYNVPDKYHGNLDDSMCDQKFLQLKSSDMIEPKILDKNKAWG